MRVKGGYFPVAPSDTLQDLRTEMVLKLEEAGIPIEAQHHEVGAAGQCEIDVRFDTLVKMADKMLLYKYIVKNTAAKNGKTVTFMPKPVYGDNGSGMHTHQSLWKEGKALFFDSQGYAGLSTMARHYIGGVLTHAPALLAIALQPPTVTSVWSPASKLPSIWFSPKATVAPQSVFLSHRVLKPSVLSSARPMPPPIHTCYSPLS